MHESQKITKSVRLDETDIKKFNNLYPFMLSKFIQEAVHKATNDKAFFESIIFKCEVRYER